MAGISIFSIIGNNGLFDKALLAKNSFIESVINEEEKINSYFNYTDESIDDNFSSKYQEIEYIESTGTQYIELFKKLNSETIIKSKFLITQFSDASLFGVYTINHDKSYGLHCSNSSSYFRVGSNASAASKNLNTIYDWTFSKNGIIDNTTNKSLLTFKKQLTPFTGDNNTPIFARRATNGDIVLGFFKIYNFTVLQDNNTEINLIPCYRKSDNIIGMYDTINNNFYTNSGTGDFLKGPDKKEDISL